MQYFCNDVLGSFGSMVKGIDIEFVDQVDKVKRYCQTKLGPNTINVDDIETIVGKFRKARNLAKQNGLNIKQENFAVGVLYGTDKELSNRYCAIRDEHNYDVFVGADFWHRLTGEKDFYAELIQAISQATAESNSKDLVEAVIGDLAKQMSIKK
jgi:hypothetical protein